MTIVKLQACVRGALARRDDTFYLFEAMNAPPVMDYLRTLFPANMDRAAAMRHFKYKLAHGEVRFRWNNTPIHSTARMAIHLSKLGVFKADLVERCKEKTTSSKSTRGGGQTRPRERGQ